MGYREDVSVAISENGWRQLLSVKNTLCSDALDELDSLLNGADEHWENPDGDHLFIFSSIKTSADDWTAFQCYLMDEVDRDQWKMVSVGEDGAEDINGDWNGNPFDLGVSHQLSYNSGGCTLTQTPKAQDSSKRYWNVVPPATNSTSPINDHTCTQCGNNACSKTEKSCWKCGAAITA